MFFVDGDLDGRLVERLALSVLLELERYLDLHRRFEEFYDARERTKEG